MGKSLELDPMLAEARTLADLVAEIAVATAERPSRAKSPPKGTVHVRDDLLLIDHRSTGKLIVKRRTGAVCAVRVYGAPGKTLYPSLAEAIAHHRQQVGTLRAGGELDITPEHGWRIERAKTGRSGCRVCGTVIAAGALRFGQDDKNATWFHLGCAAAGAPRAFRPFADKAARLLADAPPAAPAPRRLPPGAIVDALRAQPRDRDARRVFADWLSAAGDPWGELIAFAHAGREPEAKQVFAAHAADLCGGFATRALRWDGGFVTAAVLAARDPRQLEAQLARLAALRTAVVLEELYVETRPDAALFATLSAAALPALRTLTVSAGTGFEALALPRLTALAIRQTARAKDPAGLAGARLPALRALAIHGMAGGSGQLARRTGISTGALAALFASKLFANLTSLALDFGALDDAGARYVIAHADRLAHLRALELGLGRHEAAARARIRAGSGRAGTRARARSRRARPSTR